MIRMLSGKYILSFICAAAIVCASLMLPQDTVNDNLKVAKVLAILGDKKPNHLPKGNDFQVAASRGESLVKNGFATKPGGGKTRIQSKHFVCTSCHNLEQEDPDLSIMDPQARLDYTTKKGLPFLQGTTLHGVVNRESYYNDDYFKKYGTLVDAARNDLRGAIQLCAVECAQGRKLKDWEMESVLAYLWTIDLKLSDLELEDSQLDFVYKALDGTEMQDSAIALIKSKYVQRSPAHFGTAYDSSTKVKGLKGNADNGKRIYDNSCLHCHQDRKYSFFDLNDEKLTFKHLSRKADGYGRHSLMQVSRYGVYSRSGKRSYMPQYTHERMSDQQLADLKTYIDLRAD